jgi:hypothetical protein
MTFGVLGALNPEGADALRAIGEEVTAGSLTLVLGAGDTLCNSWAEDCDVDPRSQADRAADAAAQTAFDDALVAITARIP